MDKQEKVWNLKEIQAGACITFPKNAVKGPLLFRCTIWKWKDEFPQLNKDETLVSSVIELSYDGQSDSEFSGYFKEEVSIALSHSVIKHQGYEVVMKELVKSDNSEWKDLKTTNIWQTSGECCKITNLKFKYTIHLDIHPRTHSRNTRINLLWQLE